MKSRLVLFNFLASVALFANTSSFVGTMQATSFLHLPMIDNIFGVDERVALTSNQYPWRTVGKLSSGCTGTLVSPKHVLTAAHCVVKTDGTVRNDITKFYPNMINGNSVHTYMTKQAWWGTHRYDIDERGKDWAIIELQDRAGDVYGWMGTESNSPQNYINLPGYSEDYRNGQTAGVHVNCQVKDRQTNWWLHDCDDTRGSSGAAMFYMKDQNTPQIISINVAEFRNGGDVSLHESVYTADKANIAVPTSVFVQTLINLIK